MHPTLATCLTVVGIVLLMRWDGMRAQARNPALWLPVLWLSITGSRFVSQWLSLGETVSVDYSEGSNLDAAYFLTLIVAGFWVLALRGVRLGEVLLNNKWLFALVAYGLVSIAWSDFPMIAFKRWIKTLGHPLMALIILSDPDPSAALRTVLKRCAFFLLPVSVLFIKYLPEYGRGFDAWTGEAFNNGVGLTKNDLGYVCMALGIFFVWNLLTAKRLPDGKLPLWDIGLSIGFIWMALWLLSMASSATSMSTLVLGLVSLLALGWRIVSKRFIGTYVLVVALAVIWLESSFNLYDELVSFLGRDPNLTDRTELWADVLEMQDRPLFGFGFESFWLGPRLELLWEKWWWKPNQAHNGYIETYLNHGGIGVVLLLGLFLSTFRNIGRQLLTDFDLARLRFAFLFAIAAFNYTEASFKAVHFIWTIFYIIAMNYPRHETVGDRAGETAGEPSAERS